ncbi:hypothetical protein [Agrobacterium tumefaciens]|uniref:hypothetical protein n=1 Tax=Agrobacterium tumefaciens TaxID=358 RepID=UPI0021CF70BD|nr:hypothetical protein [Agrobacterium tumefaciens]
MKILLLGHYHQSMIDELAARHAVEQVKDGDFTKHLHDIDILVLRSHVGVTTADINRAGRLSLIIKAGSGFDNIDKQLRPASISYLGRASRSGSDHAVAFASLRLATFAVAFI